jgi:GH25 family lysozyme M1 (1,4-beta-N-acetylmuramidase)
MKQSLLVLLLVLPSLCLLGVDVSDLLQAPTYACIKNSNYNFAIPRAFTTYGGVDPNVHTNLNNARSVGLATDIYIHPCKGKEASVQVDQIMAIIPAMLFDTVWIKVETNPTPGCSWDANFASNCNFLTEVINRIKSYGKTVGIYSTPDMW